VRFSLTIFQQLRLIFNCSSYTLPSRNKDAWRMCLDPVFETLIPITSIESLLAPDEDACDDVASESLPSQDPLGQEGTRHTTFHTRIIQTQFEPHAPSNRRFPAPYDQLENIAWTKEERLKVEHGPVVEDVDELETLVSIFLFTLSASSRHCPSCLHSTAMVVRRKMLMSRYLLMHWRGAFL
jgi:hypothetical protein